MFNKGDQAYIFYGNRSNSFLLLHYDFCFEDNKYDSFLLELRLDFDLYDPKVDDMIEPGEDLKMIQRFKLKENQYNYLLMGYLRSAYREDFITGKDMR
jgi:hypothetical protein